MMGIKVHGSDKMIGITDNYHKIIISKWLQCLQCFDAVGWAAGRASGL